MTETKPLQVETSAGTLALAGERQREQRANEFLVRYAALCAELRLHFFAHGMHTEGYLIVEELPPEGPMMPEAVE